MDEILSNVVSEQGNTETLVVERSSWRGKLLTSLGEAIAATMLCITLIYFLLASGNILLLNMIRQIQDRRLRKPIVRIFRRLRRDVSLSLGLMAVSLLLMK